MSKEEFASRGQNPPWRSLLSTPAALRRFVATRRLLGRWGVTGELWEEATVEAQCGGYWLAGVDWLRRTDGFKATVLYALCRSRLPEVVVETGVASGTSALGVLSAMNRNGKGRLESVDLPGATYSREDGVRWTDPVTGGGPGWRVPERLRGRWRLHLGASRDVLPKVLAKVENLDLFYHDSEHTDENMLFEMSVAWSRLRPRGILAVDNIDWGRAYSAFLREHPAKNELIFPFLGLIEKPY